MIGLIVGGVQRVDVGAQVLAEQLREGLLVLQRVDARARRLERRDALRLDARLVHEGGVVVGDLLRLRAGRRSGGLLDDGAGALERVLGEHAEDAPARLVGGDLGGLLPGAVRVAEEVVAGRDGAVHALDVEPDAAARFGPGGVGAGVRASRRGQSSEGEQRDESELGVHASPRTNALTSKQRQQEEESQPGCRAIAGRRGLRCSAAAAAGRPLPRAGVGGAAPHRRRRPRLRRRRQARRRRAPPRTARRRSPRPASPCAASAWRASRRRPRWRQPAPILPPRRRG